MPSDPEQATQTLEFCFIWWQTSLSEANATYEKKIGCTPDAETILSGSPDNVELT